MSLKNIKKFNFSYDKEHDDLFLFNPESKSKGSIEIGDIIFDYNSKKEFVGLQLINASKILESISEKDLSTIKNVLDNLSGCTVEYVNNNNLLIIKINLLGKDKEINSSISIPNITESSPSIAYI